MTLRRHGALAVAAACLLASPSVLAQETIERHATKAIDQAPELQQLSDDAAKQYLKKLAEALEADANAEPPAEGARPTRPQAYMVSARENPFIARGLANNRAVSDEQVKMVVAELKMLKEKYPDQAELLDKEVFKASKLSIGREAPNIKGVDTDEVEFQLTDYRGKVVVIDFWGDW